MCKISRWPQILFLFNRAFILSDSGVVVDWLAIVSTFSGWIPNPVGAVNLYLSLELKVNFQAPCFYYFYLLFSMASIGIYMFTQPWLQWKIFRYISPVHRKFRQVQDELFTFTRNVSIFFSIEYYNVKILWFFFCSYTKTCM